MAGTFITFDPADFVVSSDAITATLWSGGSPTLSTFYTSSTQEAGSSGNFYLNVFQTASTDANAAIQFAIAYGNMLGSGSQDYNLAVDGYSPTATIFGQWQDLVIGDENTNFAFGTITSSQFYVLSVDRTRYKEALALGTLSLTLSGSSGSIVLTDNSAYTTANSPTDAWVRGQANSAYVQANTATTNAATADQRAVTSGSYANSAYSTANSASSYANSSYATANSASSIIAQNAQSTSYTLQLTDAGKHILSTNSSTQVITVPNNGNVSWNVGSTIMLVIQGSGTMNVVPQTGITMYMANNSTAKSYANLASYGMATLLNVGANTWFINGAGVS